MNTDYALKQLISLLLLAMIAGCNPPGGDAGSAPESTIVVNVASATGPEAYQVLPNRTTLIAEHENAVYFVFQTQPPPDKKFGIWFMQLQGTFANKPFLCLDADWTPGTQSHSCNAETTIPGFHLKETVTVGRLPGNFCKDLRDMHNAKSDPDPGNPILHQSECPGGAGKCTCYDIQHECRVDVTDDWDEGACPDLAALFSGGAVTGDVAIDEGDAPPGRGAGSGAAN